MLDIMDKIQMKFENSSNIGFNWIESFNINILIYFILNNNFLFH